YNVLINDIKREAYDQAYATIERNLDRQVTKGSITADVKNLALSRIGFAESLSELADCDLVIEAATEDESVKRRIFAALCPVIKPEAIIASNTSSISITRLAAATDRPERFI